MIAEAHVQTGEASRHLVQLCRRLGDNARAKTARDVRVEWTDTTGTIDFGWARCELSAHAGTLALRVEAGDHDGLRQARELISRHLAAHDPAIVPAWHQDGRPVTDSHSDRRDAMRGFHRRMRHQ